MQVHTKHKSPYGLQSTQVYDLQFELKAKVSTVKQEQAQQNTNAAVNIRQGIAHSSFKIEEKIKWENKGKQQQAFIYWKWHGPSISINWPQRVNIGSSKGLVSTNKKPLTKPMMSQSPMSIDTSNASKFTWQQHKNHIELIPRRLRSWIYHEINFYPRQHRKSFWQPGRNMWQLSISTESSRARICAVYGVKRRI